MKVVCQANDLHFFIISSYLTCHFVIIGEVIQFLNMGLAIK